MVMVAVVIIGRVKKMTLPIEVQANIVNIANIDIWQVDIIQVSMCELGHHTSPTTGL